MNVNDFYEAWAHGQSEEKKKAFKELLDKNNLEFNRYKQDCRKRALDLAAGEYADWYRESNSCKAREETIKSPPPDITALADKYYNWLISIPEK